MLRKISVTTLASSVYVHACTCIIYINTDTRSPFTQIMFTLGKITMEVKCVWYSVGEHCTTASCQSIAIYFLWVSCPVFIWFTVWYSDENACSATTYIWWVQAYKHNLQNKINLLKSTHAHTYTCMRAHTHAFCGWRNGDQYYKWTDFIYVL